MSRVTASLSAILFLGVASVASVAGCNKSPAELTPTPISSPASTPVQPKTAGSTSTTSTRCITAMSSEGPKIPPPATGAACPNDTEIDAGKLPMGEVSFPDSPNAPKIEVELAKNPHDVEKGLMFRRSMADDHGMLFKLEGRTDHKFWMQNTCIPLDMLFVDDDGLIVGIVEGAEPLTQATRSVGCPSSFVLEVNGGWTRKRGVKPGQKITIPFNAR
jgi:uncharacterized protein